MKFVRRVGFDPRRTVGRVERLPSQIFNPAWNPANVTFIRFPTSLSTVVFSGPHSRRHGQWTRGFRFACFCLSDSRRGDSCSPDNTEGAAV